MLQLALTKRFASAYQKDVKRADTDLAICQIWGVRSALKRAEILGNGRAVLTHRLPRERLP
jgi:hypothetical protein